MSPNNPGAATAPQRVAIVTREKSEVAARLGAQIVDWLHARGLQATSFEHVPGPSEALAREVGRVDLLLVLGGDGTFLSASRQALSHDIPVLGINMGRVGFLTTVRPDDWQPALEAVLAGTARIEERLVLSFSVMRQGVEVDRGVVVNDLVAGRGKLAQLVRFGLSYGNRPMTTLRCDGLIIATPTGATAYSISAGGPLVHPGLQAYSITAICPFRNDFRPLVLPADRKLVVHVEEPRGDLGLTEDGQRLVDLSAGDQVVIQAGAQPLRLVRLKEDSYFGTLIEKGFLIER